MRSRYYSQPAAFAIDRATKGVTVLCLGTMIVGIPAFLYLSCFEPPTSCQPSRSRRALILVVLVSGTRDPLGNLMCNYLHNLLNL